MSAERHFNSSGARMADAIERYRDVRKLPLAPPPIAPIAISPSGLSGSGAGAGAAHAGSAEPGRRNDDDGPRAATAPA